MNLRYTAFLTIGALILASCQGDPKESAPYQQLLKDHERALETAARQDSSMNAVLGAFNRISENLRAIRTRQGQLTEPRTGVEHGTMEGTIMADLSSIDELLAENRELIARLRREAGSSARHLAELERTIQELEATMHEKDVEIDALKEQLASTSKSLAALIDMYRDQQQLAEGQQAELNTVHYAVGTLKELRANGILTKEGGVAGIGATTKLNSKDLNRSYFREMNMDTAREIMIGAKKARLATPHPGGSYRFEDGASKLVITDPQAFWSLSKYLVVVAD